MTRVDIQSIEPNAYKAMFELEQFIGQSSLSKETQELVRLRASLINQCHFCIGMHTSAAEKLGIEKGKLEALKAWSESALFNGKEKAILAMTDHVTELSRRHVPDDIYEPLKQYLSSSEIAQLIMLIVTINAWNRIGVATAMA